MDETNFHFASIMLACYLWDETDIASVFLKKKT